MSTDKMMERVISVTRAFEKKHFGKKVEAPSSKLTTKQQAVVDVMKKEDFGCNQQKVINLMSAVMGVEKKIFGKRDKNPSVEFEKFLAIVDDVGGICVNLGTWDDGYLTTELHKNNEIRTDSIDEFDFDWRTATNEEIGQFFEELYR